MVPSKLAGLALLAVSIGYGQKVDWFSGIKNNPINTPFINFQVYLPQTAPGGSLGIGNNNILFSPCPSSFSANVVGGNLFIQNGIGNMEVVPISAYTSGSGNCTITIVATTTHTGAWTIQSTPIMTTTNSSSTCTWDFQDIGYGICRRIDTSQDQTHAQTTLWVQTDFNGTTGTPTAFATRLRLTNITTSQGVTASANYVEMNANANTTAIGIHGQCDYTTNTGTSAGACIGVNAEGSVSVASVGTPGLIGLESNMNTGTPVGATPTVLGAQIQMNNGGSASSNSVGIQLQANSGTFPKGLYITDAGGNFTNPIIISSTLSPTIPIAILSAIPGTADAPTSFNFYRGASLVSTNITGSLRTHNIASDFGSGYMELRTGVNDTLTTLAQVGDVTGTIPIFEINKHLGTPIGNKDLGGAITFSATNTGSVNFTTAWVNPPICTISPTANLSTNTWWISTLTNTTLGISTSGNVSVIFNYICVGNPY